MNGLAKVAIGIGAGVTVGVALSFYQPWILVRGVAKLTPGVVWYVPTQQRAVALTFDDGPDPSYTPQVLAFLRAAGAKATFFLIGEHAKRYPELVERIRSDGHQVANHMWRDKNALLLSENAAERSLLDTEQVLHLAGPNKWLRPSGGFARPSFITRAHELGYHVVIASAYASDPRRPPTGYIVWALTRMMRPGIVLVLHDSGGDRSRSVAAVPEILKYGRDHGYTFVTLDEIWAARLRAAAVENAERH